MSKDDWGKRDWRKTNATRDYWLAVVFAGFLLGAVAFIISVLVVDVW